MRFGRLRASGARATRSAFIGKGNARKNVSLNDACPARITTSFRSENDPPGQRAIRCTHASAD